VKLETWPASRAWPYLMIVLALFGLTGCSSVGVKPWERDLLSRPSMQWESDGVDASVDDHVYFSKEASTGGRTFGGGGCGCN
jgi:hypothetical protein